MAKHKAGKHAVQALRGGPPTHDTPQKTQKMPSDPIKGLKDALKAEQVMALAQKVAAASGGGR